MPSTDNYGIPLLQTGAKPTTTFDLLLVAAVVACKERNPRVPFFTCHHGSRAFLSGWSDRNAKTKGAVDFAPVWFRRERNLPRLLICYFAVTKVSCGSSWIVNYPAMGSGIFFFLIWTPKGIIRVPDPKYIIMNCHDPKYGHPKNYPGLPKKRFPKFLSK